MKDTSKYFYLLVFFLLILAIILRIPLLHHMPDGDESIVGIMAIDILEGELHSIFFYGQKYGLAIFEAGFAALFFYFFGISGAILKLSMLCFWTLGTLFLTLSIAYFTSKRTALWILSFYIFFPSWFLWSMKARGGYITAYFFFHFSLWIIASLLEKADKISPFYMLLGISFAITCFSQIIWSLALIPYVIYLFIHRWNTKYFLYFLFFMLFCSLFFFIISQSSYTVWSPNLFKNPKFFEAGRQFIPNMSIFFSGSFHYSKGVYSGMLTQFSGYFYLLCFFLIFIFHIKTKNRKQWLGFIAIAMILIFTFSISPKLFAFRYFLAIPGLLALIYAYHVEKMMKSFKILFFILICTLGVGNLYEIRNINYDGGVYSKDDSKHFKSALSFLKKNNISFVYSVDPMLQWNILFESKKRLLARWELPVDRIPTVIQAMNTALYHKVPFAVISNRKPFAIFVKKNRFVFGRYTIIISQNIKVLRRLGFIIRF